MYQSAIAFETSRPLRAAEVPAFGLRAPPPRRFELAVDLGEDLFSRRWWRGLFTLTALTTTVALLAPGLEPLAGGRPDTLEGDAAEQFEALAIAPLGAGSETGLRMMETGAVEPLTSAPERSAVSLFATLGAGDDLARLLVRSGANSADAVQAAALVRATGRAIAPGTSVSITLGRPLGGGARSLEQVSLRAGLDLKLTVQRSEGSLTLIRTPIPVDTAPLRIRGRVGEGLYWSLRSAGASPEAAASYLSALATQIEVGSEVSPDDSFDLIMANRRSATGESVAGPLLYAGLDRSMGSDVQLLRWKVSSQMQWVDANADQPSRASAGMLWPVEGRITSGFGRRVHPILRFARMHRGIDFGASWGAPIVAAADGQVVKAGWAGGYGRQVRIAHGGGLVTSYSHMSRIVADEGGMVRAGQLIGYVGSSGLSTGPHLHYETIRNGVAIDPMSVRFASARPVDQRDVQAIRARLQALLQGRVAA